MTNRINNVFITIQSWLIMSNIINCLNYQFMRLKYSFNSSKLAISGVFIIKLQDFHQKSYFFQYFPVQSIYMIIQKKNFFKVATLEHTLPLWATLSRIHCNDQQIIGGFIHKLYSKSILTIGKCTLHYWYPSRNINIEYFAFTKIVKSMKRTKEIFLHG